MIQPHPRLVAWNLRTQCPAVIPVEIPLCLCPGIFLPPCPVLLWIIPVIMFLVLPIPITLCAHIPNIFPSVKKVKTRCPPLPRAAHHQLLSPQLLLRNVGWEEGDKPGVQPIEMQRVHLPRHWPRMCAGPISAQQFQQERRSRFQRAATPHQRSGRQCTRLPGL